jgi:hypothetical protein
MSLSNPSLLSLLSKADLAELKRKKPDGPIILDPSDPFLPHLNASRSLHELLEIAIALKELNAIWLPSEMVDRLIAANMAEIKTSELFPQVLSHFTKCLKPFFKLPTDHAFESVLPHLTPAQANILIMRHPLSHNRIRILLEFIHEKKREAEYALCFVYLQQPDVREFLLLPTALQLIAYVVMIVMFRESLQIVSIEDCDKLSRGIRIDTIELKRNRRDYERLYIIFDFLGFRNFPPYENLDLGRDRNSPPFLAWIIQNSDHAHFLHLDANELQQLFRVNQFAFEKVVTPFSYTFQEIVDVFLKFLPFPGGRAFVRMGIQWLVNYGNTLPEQDLQYELSEIYPMDDPFMALFASICLIPHLERSQRPPTTVFEVTALIWDRIINQNFQSGEDLGLTVTRLPSSGDLTVRTDLIYQAIGMFQCVCPDILISGGILHIANADGERFDVSPVVGTNEVPKSVIERLFARLQVELTDPINNADSVHIIFWLLTLLPYDGKKEDVSDMISSILASLIACFEHKPFEHEQDIDSNQLSILDSLDILFECRGVDRKMFEQIFCRQLHEHPQIWDMLLSDKRFDELVFYQRRIDMSSDGDPSLIQCSICTVKFSTANPGAVGAQLPIWAALTVCGHSLCCGCSSQLLPNKHNPSMVNCPLCRKESNIVLVKNTEFRIGCDADDDDVGTAPGADADKNQSAKKLRFD